jgi:hypothetical protein
MSAPLYTVSPDYFGAMCDDTGIFQHAVLDVSDRSHGYCVDDNARALIASYGLGAGGSHHDPEMLRNRFAAFIQHAWNPDLRRFRNFMGFNREWLEPQGSEDSHGRTIWALGICSRDDPSASHRDWARRLLKESYPVMATFRSPRAWAFAILGLTALEDGHANDLAAVRMCDRLAGQLSDLLTRDDRPDWVWFEDVLAYDNARLPQALLDYGRLRKDQAFIDQGIASLDWLIDVQTGEAGLFRPVGSESFGAPHTKPQQFDQQPVEVAATIAACRIAHEITENPRYLAHASLAYRWLLGDNDLGLPLLDPQTGRCFDGLHPDRVNANCGAESVVTALMAAADMNMIAPSARLAIAS